MKTALTWIVCLLLALCCTPASAQLTIAAAADLHVNPAASGPGIINPLEPIHLQIVDAFLADAESCGADVLLLLGDITNQGRLSQHEALLQRLRETEQRGVRVYVLPGNHDIGEVGTDRFAQLYADFGYNEASSRDPHSLSYSVLLEDHLLLMLDTGGYTGRQQAALLSDSTLAWMQGQLKWAKGMGWPVIAAGHYPLCTAHTTAFTGKEKAIRLLKAYGVPLYLCGHLHKRCVSTQDGLTELVVDQTIAYPCSYALLTADGADTYRYQPRYIDMSEWAAQTGLSDPAFLAFDAYQEALERERCRTVVEKIRRDQEVSQADMQLAGDFFWQLMDARAHGTLSRHAAALREHPGFDIFIRIAEGSIYNSWAPAQLADAVPYTAGFVLTGGRLEAAGDGEP